MTDSRIDPSLPEWYLQNPLWQSSTLFVEAKSAIDRLRAQFANAGVSLNPTSELARLMDRAEKFASSPELESGNDKLFLRAVIQGQFLDRIARACAGIEGASNERQHLIRIKKGSVDPGLRVPSPAKDKLFELELLSLLHENELNAELSEPDIVVRSPLGPVDIACKRIYSRKNAESQISKGIHQLDRSKSHKILALCLDDLFPPYSAMNVETPEEAAETLQEFASDFLSNFEAKLFGYMVDCRVSFVIASTTVPVSYVGEEGHVGAQTQLFFYMPAPGIGGVSVEARRLCDSLFFRPSQRWETL